MIGRRGLVPLVAAVIAISASAVAANAATTPAAAAPANHAHVADGRLLPSVVLPVDFAPEGIAKGEGSTFYAASLVTGDIYRGNLQTGTGEVLVHAPAGSSAVGLKADDAAHLLFVCGGLTGTARVYNSRTGALVAQYQFAPNGASLINDVVLTAHGAYFTDSFNPDIYEIPIGPFGHLGRAVTIPLNGPVAAFSTRVTLSHDLSSGTITSAITSPLFDDPTTVAKYGNELALPNGRYDLGLPPPFGPGAPPGTTFNVVVVPAY
jgi:hypothetical protein